MRITTLINRVWSLAMVVGARAFIMLVMAFAQDPAAKSFKQSITGTACAIEMISVAPLSSGKQIWMSQTEIPWEVLDICVYGFDKTDGKSDSPTADAVTRPTKPYISMDRGFGHKGWPANSVSFHNAKGFCQWLSAKTGRSYRLPTVDEWKHACERGKIAPDMLKDYAWFEDNSDNASHKVATKKADAQGLYDLVGNLAEWCVQADGTGAVMGGSYRDAVDEIGCQAIHPNSPKWNQTDPQIPRSVWWLADAGWIGFRIVCDGPELPPDSPAIPAVPSAK